MTRYLTLALAVGALVGAVVFASLGSTGVSFVDAGFHTAAGVSAAS